MLEQTNGSHIGGAAWRAQALTWLRNISSVNELVRLISLETGSLDFPGRELNPFLHPTAFSALRGDALLVFVGGITAASQGQAIYEGYINPPGINVPLSHNAWFDRAAIEIHSLLVEPFVGRFDKVFYVGHSAGGAICEYLERLIPNRANVTGRTVVTFGSPQAFIPLQRRPLNNPSVFRWMNADDPVPLIPPNEIATVFTWGVLTRANIRRICEFDHSSMGYDVDLQFRVTRRMLPSVASLSPVASVQNWLTTMDTGADSAHAIGVYAARLATMVPLVHQLPLAVLRNGPMPRHERPGPRAIAQEVARIDGTIVNIARTQLDRPVIIPPANLFTVHRVGKIWKVRFQGADVASAPFRRRAHGLANAGNNFLRRLQMQAVVDPWMITSQFENYVAIATDPLSAIKPTLNTMVRPQ